MVALNLVSKEGRTKSGLGLWSGRVGRRERDVPEELFSRLLGLGEGTDSM